MRKAFNRPYADFYLLGASSLLLLAVGALMVFSSSSVYAFSEFKDPYYFLKRHMVFLVAGLVGAVVISRLNLRALKLIGWASYLGSLIMLMLIFTPLGHDAGKGNRNWLTLGAAGLGIQPSEFAKLALVLWGATVLSNKVRYLSDPRHIVHPFLTLGTLLPLLVAIQRDLGTAMVMGLIVFAILWIVGAPKRLIAGFAGLGVLGVLVMVLTNANRIGRILGFASPEKYAEVSRQPQSAIYGLATGGWWGVGLGQSRQKWGYLADAPHNDFVVAVLGEELGLIGTLVVLGLLLVFTLVGFRTSLRNKNPFYSWLAAGITSWFVIQGCINIAVVFRLLPVVGVPLPFLSYGGSSMLANLGALGCLLACTRAEPDAVAAAHAKKARKGRKLTALVTSAGR